MKRIFLIPCLIFVLFIQVSFAEINISSCADLNVSGEIYYLNNSISNSGLSYCMNISINNITLDCQGNTIDGIDTGSAHGIYIYRNPQINVDITIKNCTLTDWGYSLYAAYSNNITFVDNILNSNTNGFYAVLSDNNNITGNIVNNNRYGLKFSYFDNNKVTDNKLYNNRYGIYADHSESNNIRDNTVNTSWYYGVYLTTSAYNNLTNNIIYSNRNGGYLTSSAYNNTLTSNIISDNLNDIYDGGDNQTHISNKYLHNLQNKMINVSVNTQIVNMDDLVKFNISVYYLNGTKCSNFTSDISTRPAEIVNISAIGNNITGNFTVTRSGLYSLLVNITDNKNNTVKRSYAFLVNATTGKADYYFRGIEPVHGQPVYSDAKSLISTPPATEENWTCLEWIQASPDNLLVFTPNLIKDINISVWYEVGRTDSYIGVQKYLSYNKIVDYNQTVAEATNYSWINLNFTDLNWTMDYAMSWYWFALKLTEGITGNTGDPFWKTNSTHPSYVNITYDYTITPEIKSMSNADVIILSATSPHTNLNNATIYLGGTGSTNLTVQMPNTSINYTAIYDGNNCNNSNCSFTQISGELNFTLILGSEHNLTIWEYSGDGNNPPNKSTLNSPDNNSYINTNYILLNWTCTDPDGDNMTAYIYADNTINPTTLINTTTNCQNGTLYTFNWTNLNETIYYWKVTCNDSILANTSEIYKFVIDTTTPIATINLPKNNTYTNDNTPLLNATSIETSDMWYQVDGYNDTWSMFQHNLNNTGHTDSTAPTKGELL
ncbi:MAG: hypothetical protein DRP06_00210, partial [Candidatus Aenigmatarchaeota archaeon]